MNGLPDDGHSRYRQKGAHGPYVVRLFTQLEHMTLKKPLSAFVLIGASALPALAQSYDCTTTRFGSGGFVSDRIILGLDRAANAGSAYDYFIDQVHDAPIPVDLTKRSDTSYKFDWKLRNVEVSNEGSGVLSHTVTLNTAALTYTLRGRLHGYDNHISASGTCKVIK